MRTKFIFQTLFFLLREKKLRQNVSRNTQSEPIYVSENNSFQPITTAMGHFGPVNPICARHSGYTVIDINEEAAPHDALDHH